MFTMSRADNTIAIFQPKQVLPGFSANKIYLPNDNVEYFVKEPKPRKPQDIFKDDPTFLQLIKDRAALIASYV